MIISDFDEARLNSHGIHIEDLVFEGQDGFTELICHIEDSINILENAQEEETTFTAKIDGAPAIVFFSNFYDLKGPGICLKSFMSDNPKCLYTEEDIDKAYPNTPDLNYKLKKALKYAYIIPENEAWQGDCLYDDQSIEDNGDTFAFQPNKIYYQVDKKSETGKKIANSDFGVAMHTRYIGQDKNTSYKIDLNKLKHADGLFVMSCDVATSFEDNQDSIDEIKSNLEDIKIAKQVIDSEFKTEYNDICGGSDLIEFLKMFQNKYLSDDLHQDIDETKFVDLLKDFCKDKLEKRYNDKIAKVKTDAAKERNEKAKQDKTLELYNIVDDNAELLTWIISAANSAIYIKRILLTSFASFGTPLDKYLVKADGTKVKTKDEGFALGDKFGNYVKIVDRLEFSHANRSKEYVRGFERK